MAPKAANPQQRANDRTELAGRAGRIAKRRLHVQEAERFVGVQSARARHRRHEYFGLDSNDYVDFQVNWGVDDFESGES